jgi:hypothetical protein
MVGYHRVLAYIVLIGKTATFNEPISLHKQINLSSVRPTCYLEENRANTLHFHKQFLTISNVDPRCGFCDGSSIRFKFNTKLMYSWKVGIGKD